MKTIALLLICSFSANVISQDRILTPEEAKNFFNNARADEISTLTIFEQEENDREFYNLFAGKNPGEIIITGNDVFKVKAIKEIEIQNCGMFRLDSSNLSSEEIEALHKKIIKKYKSGVSFAKLIEEYAIDKSPGQEDFIFDISEMNEEYRHAFNLHLNDEIFALYVPEVVNSIVVKNSPPEKTKAVIVEQAIFK